MCEGNDPFTHNCMRIVRNVYRQGTGASEGEGKDASTSFKTTKKKVMADELRLNLMRQDFLWHTPSAGAGTKERIFNALKQVRVGEQEWE